MDEHVDAGPWPIDRLRAMARGELSPSPYLELLQIRIEEAEEGKVIAAFEPDGRHLNLIGLVHGGVAASLLDTAMGICAVSTCRPGTSAVTLEMKVTYLRPIEPDAGRVRATGTVLKAGRRVIVCEGRVEGPDGRLLAHGTGSFVVVDAPGR